MTRVLETRLRECEAQLRVRYAGLAGCQVTVEDRPPLDFARKRFNVRLEATVLDHELIVVNRDHDRDPAEAMAQAFAAAAAQICLLEGASQEAGSSHEFIPEPIQGLQLYCASVRNTVDVSRTLEHCACEHGCIDTSKCPLFAVWRRRVRSP